MKLRVMSCASPRAGRFGCQVLGVAGVIIVLAAACAGGDDVPPAVTAPPTSGTVATAPTAADSPGAVATPSWFRPRVDATWQWQLSGEVNTAYSADVYDVDLFDVPDSALVALHDAGRHVICYFSAGSHEDWRADAGAFPADAIGEPLGDWQGERWLDVRSPGVMEVLLARLDLARERGCDGVEPDNVDGFAHDTGFPLTEADQVAFNRALADAAHARGLAVALKNVPELLPALLDAFDFAITEQCLEQDWCEDVQPFVAAGKPVFDAEYADDAASAETRAGEVCDDAYRLGIATLVLPLELDDAFRVVCPAGG